MRALFYLKDEILPSLEEENEIVVSFIYKQLLLQLFFVIFSEDMQISEKVDMLFV